MSQESSNFCPVCHARATSMGAIPFDRNNAGVPIVNDTPYTYFKCSSCYFIFCPTMLAWSPYTLGNLVYNDEYIKYDPDYVSTRPLSYAKMFYEVVSRSFLPRVSHLDYGSGSGTMSKELQKHGWTSTAYDPYVHTDKPKGTYNFITAIEVFEHSLNIDATIKEIKQMLDPKLGVIVFSTQLADKDTNIDWWYIGARNGHIGILTKESLKILAIKNGLYFSSLTEGIHIMQTSRNNIKTLLGLQNGTRY